MTTFAEEYAAWHQRNFPDSTSEIQGLVVAEEAGEVARALAKRSQRVRGTHDKWTRKIREETADVVLAAFSLARLEDFDLEEAVAERWEEVKQRVYIGAEGYGMSEGDMEP